MASRGGQVRVGILGCGPIAQMAHLDAVRRARNTALHAVCDRAADLVEKVAVIHQPRHCFTSYAEMLSDPQLDAVIVAAADQFHVELSRQAVAAGKHVLVEKPLGVTIEECELLRREQRAAGVLLQVGSNRRFDPALTFARRFITDELGGLTAIKASYCDSTHRYTMTDNLLPLLQSSAQAVRPSVDPKADRRRYFMLGHGSHLVDTMRFLGGEIVAVNARLIERYDAYTWFAEVAYAGGHLGQLDLSIPIRGDFQETFTVYGQHGSINGRLFLPWYHKAGTVECFSDARGIFTRPLGADGNTYKLQLEGFADSILDGTPQLGATVDDGVAAMRAMAAMAQSVTAGEWVRLDTVSGAI